MLSSRRNFASLLFAGCAAVALAGCVTTTGQDGKTTLTLDTGKVVSYTKAGINAANIVLGVLTFVPALSPFVAPISAISNVLLKDLDRFTATTGTSATFVYDDSSVKGVVDSIISNLHQTLALLNSVFTSSTAQGDISPKVLASINVTTNALTTIVSIFSSLVGSGIVTASGGMSEAQALSVLNVS